MSINVLYSTEVTATGGRDGRAVSADGALDIKLGTPKALGGNDQGNNPEQLFAAGYAACFLSALKLVASQQKVKLPAEAAITATVGIGPRGDGGFGLEVALRAELPGVEPGLAGTLLGAAHGICPYSHATRGNIAVTTTLA